MKDTYVPFVDRMIQRYEGGYCWDQGDPGGPTKYGITCYDLAANRGQNMNSMSAWAPIVRAMNLSEAEGIYANKYAKAVDYDDLPAGVDCVLMDYAVNSGVARAPRVVRSILGMPAGSLMTGDVLVKIKQSDPKKLINDICDERLRFMHAIRGGDAWRRFGKGWGDRVADLRKYAIALQTMKPIAAAQAVPAPDLSAVPTPKAVHDDPNAGNKAGTGVVVAAGAAVAGGLGQGFSYWEIGAFVCVVAALGLLYIMVKNHIAKIKNETVHV